MKLFLVLSVFVLGAFASDRMEAVMECAKQFDISENRIKTVLCSGPQTSDEECLIDCAMKKIGMVDDGGKVNVDLAKKEVEEAKDVPEKYKVEAVKHLDKCAKVECSGGCTCAVAAMKCLSGNFDPKVCGAMFR